MKLSADLGDFTTTRRVLPVCLLALCIGVGSAYVAAALLKLIAFFTHLFYYQRLSTEPVSPAHHALGFLSILVPVVGALVVGAMARWGSERIRGHGIPEAIEAILIRGSRVMPRVAVLKPLSAAISIGSGGPFGAEGPIIMTGGAFGSLAAQFFRFTSAERKTLLVAGAAAGMSATFATPIAAVLLAVELLLFEWKPRSFLPVAIASAAAALTRTRILGMSPLFPVMPHVLPPTASCLLYAALAGLLAGGLAALLTASVYVSEDLFKRLPFHWMWWPAIGGLAIGIGGLICPRALGVGYDVIESLLQGDVSTRALVALVLVKWAIWAIALGSGTSGGVLAPLLIMGGALGGLETRLFPDMGAGFWPLISMGAILGGTMRSPLTGVLFAVELTHDYQSILPLLVAVTLAHGFTVLVLRRSILTEKVARRGFHVSREYAVDPLEVLFVREVMGTRFLLLPEGLSAKEAKALAEADEAARRQLLFPIVDAVDRLCGVVTRNEINERADAEPSPSVKEFAHPKAVVAYPGETLRVVAYRMAETGLTRLLVVDRADPQKVLGKVELRDLLKARSRHQEEERRRERVLPLPFIPADLRGTRRYADTRVPDGSAPR